MPEDFGVFEHAVAGGTGGAVVVEGDGEGLIVFEGSAFEVEVLDALAGGLGEVDFVGDAFGHVEVEAHEFGVEEVAGVALWRCAGFKVEGCVFQGGTKHGAVAFDLVEGVVVDVESGGFAYGDGALLYREAGVEEGAEANVGLGVEELDFVDGVDQGRIFVAAAGGAEIDAGLDDGAREILFCGVVVGLGEGEDLIVGDGLVCRFDEVAAAFGHLPFAVGGLGEFEVETGEGCAVVFGLGEECVAVEGFGDFTVAVAEDDGVDAGDFSDLPGEVFSASGFVDTTVGGDDDEVWLVVAPDLEEAFEGGCWVLPGVAFVVFGFFPEGDGWGGEADDGDADALNGFFKVGNEGFGVGPAGDGVGREPGETCDAAGGVHVFESVVEFVVADGHGVEAHGVHDEHHGVYGEGAGRDGDAGGEAAGLFVGLVDAFEGGALDGVADVDEEGVGGGFALFCDEGGYFGEAVIGGFLAEIVVGVDVAVEVCGGEDRDFGGLGGESGGQKE